MKILSTISLSFLVLLSPVLGDPTEDKEKAKDEAKPAEKVEKPAETKEVEPADVAEAADPPPEELTSQPAPEDKPKNADAGAKDPKKKGAVEAKDKKDETENKEGNAEDKKAEAKNKEAEAKKAEAEVKAKAKLGALLGGLADLVGGKKKKDEPEEKKLSEEVQTAFEEFTAKAAKAREETIEIQIKEQLDELLEPLKLDEESQLLFREYDARIVEEAQEGFVEGFKKWLRPFLLRNNDPLKLLENWNPEQMANNNSGVEATAPQDTKAWKEAVEAILTPDQKKKYKELLAEAKDELQNQIKDYMDAQIERHRSRLEPVMQIKLSHLKLLANLDDEQHTKLKKASEEAVQGVLDEWRKKTEKRFRDMADQERDRYLKGNYSFGYSSKDKPEKQKVWLETVDEVLTEEQKTASEDMRKKQRTARARALGMLIVEAVDPTIAFTGKQREDLLELMTPEIVKAPDQFFIPQAAGSYMPSSPQQLWQFAQKVTEENLIKIFDKGQFAAWKKIDSNQLTPYRYRNLVHSRGGQQKDTLGFPPKEQMNAYHAKRLISLHIHRSAQQETAHHRKLFDAKANAIARIAKLPPEKLAILKTAAKGAAHVAAKNAISNMERSARDSFKDIEPANLQAHIQNFGQNNSYSSRMQQKKDPALWTKTVQRILSEDEAAAWNGEQETSKNWQRKAQINIVLTDIQRAVLLSPEQEKKLHELLLAALEKYSLELETTFSFKWHWEGYYTMIPFDLLSKKELASALSEKEVTLIRSNNPGHFGNMVDMIIQRYNQRMKTEKKNEK